MTLSNQQAAWVALSTVPRVGGVLMRRLLEHFGTAEAVLSAGVDDLQQVHGVGKAVAQQIQGASINLIQQKAMQWDKQGLRILTWFDREYPARLRVLEDAPPTLFMRGAWSGGNARNIAIVGTRQPSPRARQIAYDLGRYFAEKNWTVISGLAVGIDVQAHQGAMTQPNGQTVAVLGSGLNQIYPPNSRTLAQKIVQRGALLSELLPETEANAPQLVARNRIISGLSQAVIVVEAGPTSGALYAARFAQAQNRSLCAVDFPVEGNWQLVKDGAHLLLQDLSNLDEIYTLLTNTG
jgi:DNA processing protein